MISRFVAWNRRSARKLEMTYPVFFRAPSYKGELDRRIAAGISSYSPAIILEVGGIDRPLLQKSPAYTYIGLDIETQPSCEEIYDRFLVQSVEKPILVEADMVISITLLEHVPNNTAATASMFAALRPGGTTHHYMPSKWHPYSIATRLVGPTLQRFLIRHLRPDDIAVTGYPTFFDKCSPGAMSALFQKQGFVDVDVMAFYRASDYFAFFLPAFLAVAAFENVCERLGLRLLASGFVISARKASAEKL
ncbi:MAG: class I SAM-dependent methyltransferase [Hyphomicrobium sp.]